MTTLEFAYSELKKYLEILDITAEITLETGDFNVADPYFDDAFSIFIKDKKGVIKGANQRSVLFGVYRLLEEWGITWVRPGENGTDFPEKCQYKDVDIKEVANKRHRVICIEGATSFEHVLNMIDWLPKACFNGYQLQFTNSYVFFKRWYEHQRSTVKASEGVSVETVENFLEKLIIEIKQRGLMLHRKGHGWHDVPFGISERPFTMEGNDKVPDEYKKLCAQLNGKRDLFNGTVYLTQLCYSNPFVRKTMADAVIKYAEENPEVEMVHFWLGDHYNNTCECETCREGTYADHYVRIINDITDGFKARNLKTKVVFCIAFNASYPPVLTKIKNPENTILMFAPICRTFSKSFPEDYKIKKLPEYKINSFLKPTDVDENLSHLYGWKQVYDGDVVDFDYHLMWEHVLDAGNEGIAKIIHTDIRNFDNLGINGFISCQLQRNAFPTSVALTTMAKTLWNRNTDFEKLKKDLYGATFGKDKADEMCRYFALLSDAFDVGAIRLQKSFDPEILKTKLINAIDEMAKMEKIAKTITTENPCHKKSWEILGNHSRIYILLANAIIAMLEGDSEKGEQLRKQSAQVAFECEDDISDVLDCMLFDKVTVERIDISSKKEFMQF